ncbi:MAG: PLP-dependent cysteine synthase family protein [Candidatus Bathyarchaeia archaeon]
MTSVLNLIGLTTLLRLRSFEEEGRADVYVKPEFLNPSGSIKDRMVSFCVEQAEKRGELERGSIIVEATSGNTGVSLAMVAAVKGYKAILVIPDTISVVKKRMMEAFGAELDIVPAEEGVKRVIERAREVARREHAWMLNQFVNPDNLGAYREMSEEILETLGGRDIDAFVASVGTGGTLTGVSRVLKKENPDMQSIAVEPERAPAFYNMFYERDLEIGEGIPHRIEGIGEGFVPNILSTNRGLVDEVLLVNDEDAIKNMHRLIVEEGLFVGISSGANLWSAHKIAKRLGEGKTVVTVLPDSGQRYTSTQTNR